ncbi:MAG: hypothetical protein CSB33_05005 [Desulfobacterales bacterium]|nr:MAG: hypothetical protein CSB33_05005 [Desulfobacterales bacterium]
MEVTRDIAVKFNGTFDEIFTLPEPLIQEEAADKFRAGGYGYGDAKKELLEVYTAYFASFRQKREDLEKNLDYVAEVRKKGADKAREIAMPTLEKVRKLVGTGR